MAPAPTAKPWRKLFRDHAATNAFMGPSGTAKLWPRRSPEKREAKFTRPLGYLLASSSMSLWKAVVESSGWNAVATMCRWTTAA